MARQQTVYVTGKMANLIFYNFRGRPAVRTMPKKVKQTRATKDSAKLFGKAARLSRVIREGLYPLYSDLGDASIMPRLTGAVFQCLKDEEATIGAEVFKDNLFFLRSFQWNRERELTEIMKKAVRPSFDEAGNLVLSLASLTPHKDLSVPAGTQTVILKIGACSISWNDPDIYDHHSLEINIPYNGGSRPAEEIVLPLKLKKNRLVLIGLALRYSNGKQWRDINDKKKWMPVGIVQAIWTGK